VEQVTHAIDHEVSERFPDGAVARTEVLRDDEHPGQLIVRVYLASGIDPQAHQEQMRAFRDELSLRLPSAKLLEFITDAHDKISLPDTGEHAAEQLSAREIVTKALMLLRENYVFPQVAAEVATAIEARLDAGEYDNLDEIALTGLLTEHLQAGTDDKHLRVRLGGGPRRQGPDPRKETGPASGRHRPGREKTRMMGRMDNFGIHKVERLEGNIGYLDLRRVPMPENAGPSISAAMQLVAGTYALIIDLRRNHGGSPDGVVFWCSYLFEDKPVHLNDIFHADTGETHQFWSLPFVPGERYVDKPLYVLTSSETFSGGEDFAYTLQALKRAEVIGESTGGGAHPTKGFPISPAVHIGIPFARSINPVTGTNWQGTGVVPDTAVARDEAYDTAYRKALTHVADLSDVPPPIADEARKALTALQRSAAG
jgi:Peptidase family S41/N-terminal domain of Peptidase_S41 in eukaryotic IRBP